MLARTSMRRVRTRRRQANEAGMKLVGAVLLIWIALVGAAERGKAIEAPECRPIPEASRAVSALNAFWDRSTRLCQSSDPDESALALPDDDMVLANRRWLASVAQDYGAPAAAGILAHEWAHIVRPRPAGPRAELEADCLAGAFLRRAGYSKRDADRFALLGLDSGDDDEMIASHGSGSERRAAVLRGYDLASRRTFVRQCRA
jgi:hypothetical protein